MNRSLSLLSLVAVLALSACGSMGEGWTPMSGGRTAGGFIAEAPAATAPTEEVAVTPTVPAAPVVEAPKAEVAPAPVVDTPSKADKTISESLRK